MIGTINCKYETPCGWCTKWDKKCDKKIKNNESLSYNNHLTNNPPLIKTDVMTNNPPLLKPEVMTNNFTSTLLGLWD